MSSILLQVPLDFMALYKCCYYYYYYLSWYFIPRVLKLAKQKCMSGMVMMGNRKLWTFWQGTLRWNTELPLKYVGTEM